MMVWEKLKDDVFWINPQLIRGKAPKSLSQKAPAQETKNKKT